MFLTGLFASIVTIFTSVVGLFTGEFAFIVIPLVTVLGAVVVITHLSTSLFTVFLATKLGKICVCIVAVLLLFAAGFGYLKLKEYEATQAALAQFNAQQLELTNKQNAAYKLEIDNLTKEAQTLQTQNDALNKAITDNAKQVEQVISQTKDTTFDPIFKALNNLK